MNSTDPAAAERAGGLYAELSWNWRYLWRLRVIDPRLAGGGICHEWLLGFMEHDEQAAQVLAMASLEEHGWSPTRAFEEHETGRIWTVPVAPKEPGL